MLLKVSSIFLVNFPVFFITYSKCLFFLSTSCFTNHFNFLMTVALGIEVISEIDEALTPCNNFCHNLGYEMLDGEIDPNWNDNDFGQQQQP